MDPGRVARQIFNGAADPPSRQPYHSRDPFKLHLRSVDAGLTREQAENHRQALARAANSPPRIRAGMPGAVQPLIECRLRPMRTLWVSRR